MTSTQPDPKGGEQVVISNIRMVAMLLQSISEACADDRNLGEGLANFSTTLRKATDGFDSLSIDGQLTLAVLSMWFMSGKTGLNEAVAEIAKVTESKKRSRLWGMNRT